MKMSHFEGKQAVEHVIEAGARGKIAETENHSTELPGHLSAGADAAKETGVILALLSLFVQDYFFLFFFGIGITIWKFGRSAWLGWSRLERLHRLTAEEKWEIDHHRNQEREELKALYQAKGFEGQLLEDVMDVLMADGDRLLKVMLEEELGLKLEKQEHPLKQALGAGSGALIALVLGMIGFSVSTTGLFIAALSTTVVAAIYEAYNTKNQIVKAVVWSGAIVIIAYGTVYFGTDAWL